MNEHGQSPTRLLEQGGFIPTVLRSASLRRADPGRLELDCSANLPAPRASLELQNATYIRISRDVESESEPATLVLETVAPHIVRVRYAHGPSVPHNVTEMLVGSVAPVPADVTSDESTAMLRTTALSASVDLHTGRVSVRDATGREVCAFGGLEKNEFRLNDTLGPGFLRPEPGGRPIGVVPFDLAHDESIYGFGETFLGLDKVGQTIDLDTRDGVGVITDRAYKPVPFYVSSAGYGVYFNHSSRLTCWVGSRTATDVQVAVEDDFLDLFIVVGTIKEVLAAYTSLTGPPALPPRWSFGYWQSKLTYHSAEETLEIAHQLRAHDLPCDVIHLDTHWFPQEFVCDFLFDDVRFADAAGYIAKLRALGIRLSLWQLPYLRPGTQIFGALEAVDGFVKDEEGGRYRVTPNEDSGCIDFTNPAAVQVYTDAIRSLLRLGVAVIKTDFGEAAPADGVYAGDGPPHQMHNLYPLLYNKAVFETTKEETGDGVVWARSAWAGSQRYPIHWGGDNSPHLSNQAPQLAGGLSFGLSGVPFWSQDIGGFTADTNDALLRRWFPWSMFLSHTRIHGWGDRELYVFEPETVDLCREYLHLRYRMLPYILGSAERCVAESLPMARALVIEFPDDRNVRRLADEWLFGDRLLVAPVLDESGGRDVYLPAGRWADWWTGETFEGEHWIHVKDEPRSMPLFVREGSVVPLGPLMHSVDEHPLNSVELVVAPFRAEGTDRFDIPTRDGGHVTVEYTAAGGRHGVRVSDPAIDVQIRVLGAQTVTLD